MLIPDKGDKKAMELVLAKKNLTWGKVKSKSPDWLWKRVRRYIPDKDKLYPIVKEFFNCWGPVKCSLTGYTLFSAESWKKANRVLHDIKMGWISDPSDIPLYTLEGRDANGLPIYHCIRGTNSVEGSVHNPIKRNFASLNASPELADALLADFRHRHNCNVGSTHKLGNPYSGHYDPWIDHDILQLRSDIRWKTHTLKTITASGRALQDTDPLSFCKTEEQFGITQIPGVLWLQNDFNAYPVDVNKTAEVYPIKLHLSKLQGARRSMYEYLANAQNTKYAVVPLHTEEEFKLFHQSVSVGGQWSVSKGMPNFDLMARWWSSQANGKTIFYKVREHLSNYYKTWLQACKATESTVASLSQRRKNYNRIHSAGHHSHVLPAAPCSCPGVLMDVPDSNIGTAMEMVLEAESSHDVEMINQSITASASLEQEQPVQHLPHPAETAVSNQAQPTASASFTTTQPPVTIQTPDENFVFWGADTVPKRKRKCAVCIEAGRNGYNCPGEQYCKRCKYL